MYAFGQRSDTTVVDEPLYAYYLKVSRHVVFFLSLFFFVSLTCKRAQTLKPFTKESSGSLPCVSRRSSQGAELRRQCRDARAHVAGRQADSLRQAHCKAAAAIGTRVDAQLATRLVKRSLDSRSKTCVDVLARNDRGTVMKLVFVYSSFINSLAS